MTRAQQLANALVEVARVNHYMVGIVEVVTLEELDAAEQLMITKQNKEQNEFEYNLLDDALDIVQQMIKNRNIPVRSKESS